MNLYLMQFFQEKNLPSIKDGTHVRNLDDKKSKGTHWIPLFINKNVAVYFDFFGIEYNPLEVLKKILYSQYIQNTIQ